MEREFEVPERHPALLHSPNDPPPGLAEVIGKRVADWVEATGIGDVLTGYEGLTNTTNEEEEI
jgi:hypothetical protein